MTTASSSSATVSDTWIIAMASSADSEFRAGGGNREQS